MSSTTTTAAWARVACWVAVGAMALAVLPRFVSEVGAVAGFVAVVFGVQAVRRHGRSAPALVAIGIGTVAVVVGVVMTFVYLPKPPKWDPEQAQYYSDSTETVLADQLTVTFGEPRPGMAFGRQTKFQVPVTLTNRLDEARTYTLDVVALDGNVQLATELVVETLAPHQTLDTAVFDGIEVTPIAKDLGLDRLRGATYQVLQANSYPEEKGR